MPLPDADWLAINEFALAFDGYQYWGSFDKCADIANARLNRTLTELRTCLFFEQRRWRHLDCDPDPEAEAYIRILIEKIRRKIISRKRANMPKFFIPSTGPDSWRALLADPERHWAKGYSARTLAHCWEDAGGFPPEVSQVLNQNDTFAGIQPLLVFPEWKVPLPGGSRPSQNDIWVLARCTGGGLVSMAVEGKVNEAFDKTLDEWLADASAGRKKRLSFLCSTFGLTEPLPSSIRYQLLHRLASAIIEAQRFGAKHAVLIIHSFSPFDTWFDDFRAFVELFGIKPTVNELVSAPEIKEIQLHFGWVRGNPKFLNS